MRNMPPSITTVKPTMPPVADADQQKRIDLARDLLMHQRSLSADEAYAMLCTMADKRKVSLTDIATQLLEVSRMLTL